MCCIYVKCLENKINSIQCQFNSTQAWFLTLLLYGKHVYSTYYMQNKNQFETFQQLSINQPRHYKKLKITQGMKIKKMKNTFQKLFLSLSSPEEMKTIFVSI